jgi:phosphatidylglycerophosphate synthase
MTLAVKRAYAAAVHAGGTALVHLRLGPNAVTLLALAVGLAGALSFVVTHDALTFALVMGLGAFLDALDGEVARRTGSVTAFGGYLDAMCDRFYEGAVILAVATVSGHHVLCFLFLFASYTVSYAKARTAIVLPISNEGWPDFMGREGRMLGFVTSVLVYGTFPDARLLGHDPLAWCLIVLIILVAITAAARMRKAHDLLAAAHETVGREPKP